jgi:hypothetical protein
MQPIANESCHGRIIRPFYSEATAGYNMKLQVRIELSGDLSDEVVEEANEILGGVSEELRLK